MGVDERAHCFRWCCGGQEHSLFCGVYMTHEMKRLRCRLQVWLQETELCISEKALQPLPLNDCGSEEKVSDS